jgi:hypothetical protein
MQIYNVRRDYAGGSIVARFDLQVDGMRVFNIELRRSQRGELRAYAPSPNSRRIVMFDKATELDLIAQAQQQLGAFGHEDSNAA